MLEMMWLRCGQRIGEPAIWPDQMTSMAPSNTESRILKARNAGLRSAALCTKVTTCRVRAGLSAYQSHLPSQQQFRLTAQSFDVIHHFQDKAAVQPLRGTRMTPM